jgi:hypothetical protein
MVIRSEAFSKEAIPRRNDRVRDFRHHLGEIPQVLLSGGREPLKTTGISEVPACSAWRSSCL